MIKIHLSKKHYEDNFGNWKDKSFATYAKWETKINKNEDVDIPYTAFKDFDNRKMFKDKDLIYVNRFGFTNFTDEVGEKTVETIESFPFDQDSVNFTFFDNFKLKNEELDLSGSNSLIAMMEALSTWAGEEIIRASLSEKILINYLTTWCKLFGVKLENSEIVFELQDFNEDFTEFPKIKFGNQDKINWKTFKCYDNPHLNNNLITVSQEQIISSILKSEQSASSNLSYSDHFITAPTGSGKSLIFQTAAYHLAKNKKLTIIISPLKALMHDQVKEFKKHYLGVETINSDTNFMDRLRIIDEIKNEKINILYVSPETLLANSYSNIFSNRKLSLLIVDEAHIATTWGKGFRPDYWYLDSWIRKTKKTFGNFTIATFTATASYSHNNENAMNRETVSNLDMINPIEIIAPAYRSDITYDIIPTFESLSKDKYEQFKIEEMMKLIERYRDEKMIIYFPYKSQITTFSKKLSSKNIDHVIYHGDVDKYEKEESVRKFTIDDGKLILATKAFGMGIDIPDIKHVVHFAPTGNLNDYLQEVGRAARDKNLTGIGHARPVFHNGGQTGTDDLTFVNALEGMSAIRDSEIKQIAKTIKNVYEKSNTRNLLIDMDNFGLDYGEKAESRNKIAFVMLQREIMNTYKFPGIIIRPSMIFTTVKGTFMPGGEEKFIKYAKPTKYYDKNSNREVYEINLESIWEELYGDITFPQFKLYFFASSSMFKHLDITPLVRTKFTELRSAIKPKQIIEFDTSDIFQKIKLTKIILKNLINDLCQNGIEFSIKSDIPHVAAKNNLKPGMIIDLLNAYKTYQNLQSKKRDGIFMSKLTENRTRGTYQVKDKNIFKYLCIEAEKTIYERLTKNYIVFPLSSDYMDAGKGWLLIFKILEMVNQFSIEIKSGNNPKVFVRVNSIDTLNRTLDDTNINSFVKEASRKHKFNSNIMKLN